MTIPLFNVCDHGAQRGNAFYDMLRAMPEYPDITVYVERLDALLTGRVLEAVRVPDPFLLRTADPP